MGKDKPRKQNRVASKPDPSPPGPVTSEGACPSKPIPRLQRWLGGFNEPLTIVTLLLFLATLGLYQATRDLVHDADHNARRQLRAYVNVTQSELEMLGPEKPGKITVWIKNSGQTPAYKLQYSMNIFVGPYPLKETVPIKQGEATSILGPSVEVLLGPAELGATLTQDQVKEVYSGRMAVYAQGIVRYVDAFNEERATKFNLFYRGNGRTTQEGVPLRLSHAKEGNDAD